MDRLMKRRWIIVLVTFGIDTLISTIIFYPNLVLIIIFGIMFIGFPSYIPVFIAWYHFVEKEETKRVLLADFLFIPYAPWLPVPMDFNLLYLKDEQEMS